jgi:hydrogenase nickel incorporation protein HypA/HybF
MHEFSMTSQIVESVLREAREHQASRVLEVHITIGEYTFLNPEQLTFWFDLLSENTLLEGSRLEITEKEGVVSCSDCGYRGTTNQEDDPEFHFSTPTLACPHCGGRTQIEEGKECTITRVRMMSS